MTSRAAVATAAAVLLVTAGSASAQDFRWHGAIAQGSAIEIKGVNGDVRAEPSGSNEVEVVAEKHARRDNPDDVRIEVVPHAGGVTICAVYPSKERSGPNECVPGEGGRMNVRNNDITVAFTVRVPAGVTFIGRTVNGGIEATRLNGDVDLKTVNGSITFSTTAGVRAASTVNGSIRGSVGRADWTGTLAMDTVNGSITLTLPSSLGADVRATTVNGEVTSDFQMTVNGTVSRRRLDATIGGGGRMLTLDTVNGSLTLRRE